MSLPLLINHAQTQFISRHIGPNESEQAQMLAYLDLPSLNALMAQTLPENIALNAPLTLNAPLSEAEALRKLEQLAQGNRVAKSYIGMGYHPTHVPAVIQRNVLENPGWYTAYTPYQSEIAQGRLEALLNFQQMSMDLSGLDLANASLLDEATAAAEAMALARRVSKNKQSQCFFVADDVHPQTLDVVAERARHFGFELICAPAEQVANYSVFGALFQYPSSTGLVRDLRPLIDAVHQCQGIVAVAADILALVLLTSPGEQGADIVLGSAQRFGVPMAYGGPHAAFFATRSEYKRAVAGRIIGVSTDVHGKRALRMALQTREQHIRREKANSNICTAQVLLANMSAFYAQYHGAQGLKNIAERVHKLTCLLALGLEQAGIALKHHCYFDTLVFASAQRDAILARADAAEVNLRVDLPEHIGISLNETTNLNDIDQLFEIVLGKGHGLSAHALSEQLESDVLAGLRRDDDILQAEVFCCYHSETEMLRYLHKLERKDLALNHSMIALGSCTMKLNASAQMQPISWPQFANMHPFCPAKQAQGYAQLISELEAWLMAITGFDAICMQPNSGAQGEYAGLLAIQKYHTSCGQTQRNVCLIPSSAHGTNPASASMAGLKVVMINCDAKGNIDLASLDEKLAQYAEQLSCLMLTYPSTHGVFETRVKDICARVHECGGQVYLDGANLNAQVGLTSPAVIGADVSHINLHKTFAIPHGGGGPGMGPIGVKAHLAPFVAGHFTQENRNPAVAAAPFGSAGILPISWMYIALLGQQGVKAASEVAILNANYVAQRLSKAYSVLYRGEQGRVAHECIIDLRELKQRSGVSEQDVAKRLMDYGFHAPTMSFPVAGTLMIEPTESESFDELDRFI